MFETVYLRAYILCVCLCVLNSHNIMFNYDTVHCVPNSILSVFSTVAGLVMPGRGLEASGSGLLRPFRLPCS